MACWECCWGEIVGEMALLSDEPRSTTIYAERESDLLFFGKREFAIRIEKHPRFLRVEQHLAGGTGDSPVCEGRIIAIDVSPPVDLLQNTDYGDALSEDRAVRFWGAAHAGADRLPEHQAEDRGMENGWKLIRV